MLVLPAVRLHAPAGRTGHRGGAPQPGARRPQRHRLGGERLTRAADGPRQGHRDPRSGRRLDRLGRRGLPRGGRASRRVGLVRPLVVRALFRQGHHRPGGREPRDSDHRQCRGQLRTATKREPRGSADTRRRAAQSAGPPARCAGHRHSCGTRLLGRRRLLRHRRQRPAGLGHRARPALPRAARPRGGRMALAGGGRVERKEHWQRQHKHPACQFLHQ